MNAHDRVVVTLSLNHVAGGASWPFELPGTDTDAIVAPGLDSVSAGPGSKYVAVRDISTGIPEWELIALIVVGLGVAGAVDYAATQ